MDISQIDVACPPLMAAQDFARIKLCAYYASFGKKSEQELKAAKAGLVEFGFLNEKSSLNPLYKALVKQFKLAVNWCPESHDESAIEFLKRFNSTNPQPKMAPTISAVDWSNFSVVGAVSNEQPVFAACNAEFVDTLPIAHKHNVLSLLNRVSDRSA